MSVSKSEAPPIWLYDDQEERTKQVARVAVIIAATATALALTFSHLALGLFIVAATVILLASGGLLNRYGRRRSLVLRAHDLYTVGCEPDHIATWDELA